MTQEAGQAPEVEMTFDGKRVGMNPFLRQMIASTISGLISPLRGGAEARVIEIRIRRPG
ncbi:MAG: hypothetical protein HYS09_00965 [Chloroflexi bacterium]|nr:hypothetical protein [Chloroflexota bacterium]